jgi:hypothetical protein
MFEPSFAALLRLRQAQDLAHSAVPDAPAQPAPAGANGSTAGCTASDRPPRDRAARPLKTPNGAGPLSAGPVQATG